MINRLEKNYQEALLNLNAYKIKKEDMDVIYEQTKTLIKRYESVPEKYWDNHRSDTSWEIDFIIYGIGSIGARYSIKDLKSTIIEAHEVLEDFIKDFCSIFTDPKTEKLIQQRNKEISS